MLFEGQNPKGVLLLETMKPLLQEGKIDLPAITEKEIQDRSKGDGLSKVLAVGQTSWYILQVIARHFEGLVVTKIELITTALAVLNIVIYFLWWNKPLDVRCSIPVPLLDILKPEEERVVFEISSNARSIAELQDSKNGPHSTEYIGVLPSLLPHSSKYSFRVADTLRLYTKLAHRKSLIKSQFDRMALWYWTVLNDQHKPRLQRVVFFHRLLPNTSISHPPSHNRPFLAYGPRWYQYASTVFLGGSQGGNAFDDSPGFDFSHHLWVHSLSWMAFSTSLHQENSNRVAGLAPDQPDASRLSEYEWRHNTLPMS